VEPNSILLTESTYRKLFGDRDYKGKTVELNAETYTVTGILEDLPTKSFFQAEALVSMPSINIQQYENWQIKISHLSTFIKLAPKISPEVVEAKIQSIHDNNYLDTAEINRQISLQPIKDIHLLSHLDGDPARNSDIRYVIGFSFLALFILLLACINFINLSTARSLKRAREVGIRKVIGARRIQLISQFLGESILLTLISLIVALILVELLLPHFSSLIGRDFDKSFYANIPFFFGIVCILILVSVGSGIFPALHLSAYPTIEAVKGNILNKPKKIKNRDVLVFSQFVIASSLILASLVTYHQLKYIYEKDLGFQPDQIVVLPVDEDPNELNLKPIKSEILSYLEFENVSLSNGTPFVIEPGVTKQMELRDGEKEYEGNYIGIDFDFVDTYGIKLSSGRLFDPTISTDVELSLLVNRAAVDFMGWRDAPIGKTLALPRLGLQYYLADGEILPFEPSPDPLEVIGVIEDFHFSTLYNEINPLVMFITENDYNVISVRINSNNMKKSMDLLGEIWQQHLPDYCFEPVFITDKIDAVYFTAKKQFAMLSVATLLSVFIGLFGLIGLSSYTIESRTKEICIRKVLGASSASILLLLGRGYSLPILLAVLLSSPVAVLIMNGWLKNFAYRIEIGWQIILSTFLATISIFILILILQAFQIIRKNVEQSLRSE